MSKLLRGPMSGSKIAGFSRGTRGAALAAGCLVFTLAAFAGACRLSPQPDEPEPSEKAERTRLGLSAVLGGSSAGFARALAPRAFRFPEDHGPHPEFRTEWWYATGNLATPAGRRFGFQLTFFRNALAPETPDRPSRWAARDVYMAHFALTDAEGGRFLAFERFRRGALGLAGARALPFRVALDDWSIASLAPGSTWPARLRAQEGGAAIDIQLDQGKPPVLEGDRGLSQKSAAPGQASYYYSLPRMPARGDIRLGGESFAVSGLAWLDREWSTSALAADQVGWDWLALQLDDGRELMLYRLRRRDGSADPASRATLILADGASRAIPTSSLRLAETATWTSPASGARYPSRWHLEIPAERLSLDVRPLLADQELRLSFRYWEGAVEVAGRANGRPIAGHGYVEMTGYAR